MDALNLKIIKSEHSGKSTEHRERDWIFFFFRFFYAASWALSCTCYKGLAGILAVAGAMGMGRVAGSRGIYREAGLVGQDVS